MTRSSSISGPVGPDPTAINLSRMISRLQSILNTLSSDTETKLRSSRYERQKVGTNIEYARTLLLKLEQDALQIKIQTKKQEAQVDLVRKRDTLDRMAERLDALSQLGDHDFDSEASSEGEDLLREDTPGDGDEMSTDDLMELTPPLTGSVAQSTESLHPDPERVEEVQMGVQENTIQSEGLRVRNQRVELFATTSSRDTGISTATTEALLTHNRTEQESLTSSLLFMAQQLKASSNAFASSLVEEQSILNRATEGLDKNELGMEAAQKRMGYLRTMTEGRGWIGRMLMYAWIAGLAVLALVIVFVLPKLRF